MTEVLKRRVERIKNCPECKSNQVVRDYKNAELYCSSCGLILDENIIDLGPEWRAFDSEEKLRKVRVGAPMTYRSHDKGLGTFISPSLLGHKSKRWQYQEYSVIVRKFGVME